MKLALGSAQFGVDYGVSNRFGRVAPEMVQRVLSLAAELGIGTLDTAAAYGKCESILGANNLQPFNIVSKVIPRDRFKEPARKWIRNSISESLSNLNVSSLYALLLHRADDLLGDDAEIVYRELLSLKYEGFVKKVGVSVYTPEEVDKIFSRFKLDIVQAPMNIIDRRMQLSGCLERLKQAGVEVHIRSAFLQGLLLMEPNQRPSYFSPWQGVLSNFDQWVKDNKLSKVEACLGFLNSQNAIDRIVVGVQNTTQLHELALSASLAKIEIPEYISSSDNYLINPALWTI
tara:strand:+ start:11777 stop:12640 length:864 start_codon:yes stop_codon:yes gene_type:complete